MFYEETQIKNLLKCEKCTRDYDIDDQPRFLPCHNSICNKCLSTIETQAQDGKFNCDLCLEEHYLPDKGFTINQVLSKLIKARSFDLYTTNEYEQLRVTLNDIKTLTDQISFNCEHGIDKIKEHCIEQRRLVQLATEQEIKEINKINEEYIKKIDDFQTESVEKFETNLFKLNSKEIINEAKQLLDESLYTNDHLEIQTSNTKSKSLKRKLENELTKSNGLIFSNNLITFNLKKRREDEEILGILHFKTFNYNEIISCSSDNSIKLWNLNTGKCIKTLYGHTEAVTSLALSSNLLASGSLAGILKIWNLETSECLKTINAHSDAIRSLKVISPEIFFSGSDDSTIKMWDLKAGTFIKSLDCNYNTGINCIDRFSINRIVCSTSYSIKLLDMNTGECLKYYNCTASSNWSIQAIGNNQIVSTGDKLLQLWDMQSTSCVRTFKGHTDTVRCAKKLSEDKLISCSADKTIKIWDLKSGVCLKTINAHTGTIYHIEVISENEIISCSADKKIKIWDLKTGYCLKTLEGHSGEIHKFLLIKNF